MLHVMEEREKVNLIISFKAATSCAVAPSEKPKVGLSIVYRQSDRYYNDIMMMPDGEVDVGIENTRLEPYEYTDQPKTLSIDPRTNSTTTLRSSSAVSLKEMQTLPSSSPNGETKTIGVPKKAPRTTKPQIVHVPQTDV